MASPARRTVRLNDDMLISYATVPGYVSYRNRESGTWFISAICKVFASEAWEKDLREMLDDVDKIVEAHPHDGGPRQTTEVVSRGFNKKLFFNPGFRECEKCTHAHVDKEEAVS